ncbi:MAG: helix-turn-helix transcriptional regulator [Tyzzerella sp.]|nr:helix-turn-helix transcriptional regulator [Tyzzerella sp.]
MNFANTLKNLRELNDVTQEQLAEYLQVSRPTVAGYETKNHQPDYEKLEKIANYFEVSIDYLVSGSTSPKQQSKVKAKIDEKTLEQELMITYRSLSPESKQDALELLKLLQLRDRQ